MCPAPVSPLLKNLRWRTFHTLLQRLPQLLLLEDFFTHLICCLLLLHWTLTVCLKLINNTVSFYSSPVGKTACFAGCSPRASVLAWLSVLVRCQTAGEQVESPLPNRKKTPVGRGVLKAYFATVPSLPLLVWVNLHAGGQVFKFPSEQTITEMNILSWLEKLKAGLEIPSSK